MSDKIRTCIVCGTKYEFCYSCKNGRDAKNAWRMIYHDENCRDIWHTITTFYDMNGAEKTVKELNKLNIDNVGDFKDGVKNKIEKIFSEAKSNTTVTETENKEDNISE